MIPKVSVIVPGYNASRSLKASLSSLRSQDWPRERIEIIYVDDASTDESIEVASEFVDQIVPLTGFPSGPAGARNSGARRSWVRSWYSWTPMWWHLLGRFVRSSSH